MSWRLRQLPVCASTEIELERWLRRSGSNLNLESSGLVVVARRQRHGRGQRGRHWVSPAGGLWLSAAFAWPADGVGQGAPLTLSVALALCLQLEGLGLSPRIKWPNDVLLDGHKLAGILPRLRLQGMRVRWAQVGLGLNGINRVPAGAMALGAGLNQARKQPPLQRQGSRLRRFHPRATPRLLLPLALASLDWSRRHAHERELVLQQVEQRLHRPAEGWLHGGQHWRIEGLADTGGLQLQRAGERICLQGLDLSPADCA